MKPVLRTLTLILVVVYSLFLTGCFSARVTPTPRLVTPTRALPAQDPTRDIIPGGIPLTGPTDAPAPAPTALPATEAPLPSPTTEQQPTAPVSGLPDACSLITAGEVAGLIPNPPAPVSQVAYEEGMIGAGCRYEAEGEKLTIFLGLGQGIVDDFQEHIQNMKGTPNYRRFSASGADISLSSGKAAPGASGSAFAAVILKGNLALEITSTAEEYEFDEAREKGLLKAIAARLPSGPAIDDRLNACLLFSPVELASLIPDLPDPLIDFRDENGEHGSTCTYQNNDTTLTISYYSAPGRMPVVIGNVQDIFNRLSSTVQFNVAGTDVYMAGGQDPETHAGDFFTAAMLKGETAVVMRGSSLWYAYLPERLNIILTLAASRLP